MKPFVLYILVYLVGLPPVKAQTVDVNKRCQHAYTHIIALQFEDAKKLINREKTENPQNLYTTYLENSIDFLTLFMDENESYYSKIEHREDIRLNLLDELPDSNPYKKYLQANINLQWAIAKLKFHDYFSSALGIRRSYLLINENRERFPNFKPQQITLGVLHIIIGMVPDRYQWILSLISMEGTVPQGEEELDNILDKADIDSSLQYLKPEILFYLGFTEMNLGLDKTKKQQLMTRLAPYTRHNLMLTFLNANMLARSGNNDKALQLLDSALLWKGYYPFYYLHYLKGEYRLRKLDLGASTDYRFYTAYYTGVNFIKDSWRKTGWCYLLQGDTAGYRVMMNKVLENGSLDVDADKEAQKEALEIKIPNVVLIKTRLLFDGGYNERARQLLVVADTTNYSGDEILERLYRLGRIEHKSNNYKAAKKYYIKTLEQGKNSSRYFAGNAALQMGNIFEMENNYPMALKYYQICRNLDFDEYETSIKDKAKQGIKRIENKK